MVLDPVENVQRLGELSDQQQQVRRRFVKLPACDPLLHGGWRYADQARDFGLASAGRPDDLDCFFPVHAVDYTPAAALVQLVCTFLFTPH